MKINKLGIIIDQWNGDKPYPIGHSISKHHSYNNKNHIYITRVNRNEFSVRWLGFFIEIKFKQ